MADTPSASGPPPWAAAPLWRNPWHQDAGPFGYADAPHGSTIPGNRSRIGGVGNLAADFRGIWIFLGRAQQMDLSKLGRTEQVLSAAGILLFIFSFLPWFEVSIVSFSASAWSWPSGFNDWFPILLLFAYGVVLALPAFGVTVNVPTLASAV